MCSGWEAAGAAAFDSLGALTSSGSSARTAGNVTKEPSLSATYEPLPDSAKGKGNARFRASVPVWIHVISDGATGNVPQSVIDKQMSVLNLSFGAFYGGAKSGFSFTLAGVTRTDNAAWYNARSNSNPEREMKKTLHRGGFETLNVYTNLAGGFLGYAYLPGLPDSHLWQDGIVLNWESMPDASPTFEGRYDLGFTLVHEAGHWFNLEHTFFGGCNAKGDFVDDTPPMREPTRGCPDGQGHVPRARARSDPQLHGLLGRPLLQPVHRGAGRPRAGRLALLPSSVGPSAGGSSGSRPLHSRLPAPVAQGIERSPPERKVARSNRAGRISEHGSRCELTAARAVDGTAGDGR